MKHFLLLIAVLALLVSCKNKEQSAKENITTTGTVADAAADSTDIRKVITDFYTWYNSNYTKMMAFKLYSGIKKPDEPPYKINWDEVDKYQAFIKDSVLWLGTGFIANQKKMFEQCDSAFKIDMQDEIPYGFDYDWYTNSQEDPSYLLEGIKASQKWMLNVKGEDATVEIGAPEDKNYAYGTLLLFVALKKENGQWKITKIGND